MINESEYLALRAKYDFYHSERNRLFPGKSCFTPEMQAQFPESLKSEDISAIEVYEFVTKPPKKYTAYVNVENKTVTTWPGESLGKIQSCSQTYKNNMGVKMRKVWWKGINGKYYYGFYPYENQDCCNFREIKPW